jgi:hypothetical protein
LKVIEPLSLSPARGEQHLPADDGDLRQQDDFHLAAYTG